MTIRHASTADIALIRMIAHATWPTAYASILSADQLAYMLDRMYSEEALHQQFIAKGHRFLLAELNDAAVGFASFGHHVEPDQHTRLHKLYVLPFHQSKGVGGKLLRAVLEAARLAEDGLIELNVNRYNRATQFYLAHGFQVVRDEVIDIGNAYVMDDHVMRRPI